MRRTIRLANFRNLALADDLNIPFRPAVRARLSRMDIRFARTVGRTVATDFSHTVWPVKCPRVQRYYDQIDNPLEIPALFSFNGGVPGNKTASKGHRGRDARHRAPPAQIPAGAIRAPGSHLG
jgi:hypothetical protein